MNGKTSSRFSRSILLNAAAAALCLAVLFPHAAAAADCSGFDDCSAKAEDAMTDEDFAAAVEYYEAACAAAPESVQAKCRENAAYAWLNKGDDSYYAKDYPAAIKDFTRAVELAPDNADPYIYRGDAYSSNGNRPEAVADYTKALSIQPSNAAVLAARGNVYYYRGKYEAAIEDLSRSIELRPIAKTYYFRADAYRDSAKYDLAISDYTKAVELDPSMENIILYRGDSWMFKGDLDKAFTDYSRVSEIKPDEWKSFAYIAELYIMKRDKENAIAALTKALDNFSSVMPDDETGALQLFLDSLTGAGKFPDPDDIKKKAQDAMAAKDNPALAIYAYANFIMRPQSPEANYLLAESYEHIGWKISAIRYYRRYIYLAPGSKINNVARNAIKSLEQ